MNNEKVELDLLVDLAKLLKKHGVEAFDALAKALSSPDFPQRLIPILTATAKAGRASAENRSAKRRVPEFRAKLVEAARQDPERGKLLLELYDGLLSKRLLPTLRDIQLFLTDHGRPASKSHSRDKAIVDLLQYVGGLSLSQLKERFTEIKAVPVRDDRSLEGWSNIILGTARPH